MSDRPQRTNEYIAEATTERYRQCVFEWLAAHAHLWNQITYRRRQAYFAEDGDVWNAEYTDLYDQYAPILGKATCQQVTRKNSEAWRSHFRLLERYHDDSDPTVTEKPNPPGYWGNRNDGYELHGLVRNDLYDLDWGEDRSALEFGVGETRRRLVVGTERRHGVRWRSNQCVRHPLVGRSEREDTRVLVTQTVD
nr:hypothetical protein [Natronolimnobius sp. AArcel1]